MNLTYPQRMSSYLLIIGALVYTVSPIDLIRDIPPKKIGWLDDLFVILFVLIKLKNKGDNIMNTISIISLLSMDSYSCIHFLNNCGYHKTFLFQYGYTRTISCFHHKCMFNFGSYYYRHLFVPL